MISWEYRSLCQPLLSPLACGIQFIESCNCRCEVETALIGPDAPLREAFVLFPVVPEPEQKPGEPIEFRNTCFEMGIVLIVWILKGSNPSGLVRDGKN